MKDILSFIEKNDDFLLATHINPEGDALGSSIALSMALESIGKKTAVYDKDGVPEIYKFLPGQERVSNALPADTSGLSLILLDCNTPERAGIDKDVVFKNTAVIDHHETERDFGDIKWVSPYAPATGLMVFELIKALGVKITEAMAVNLYAAMAIDTGTFRFANTNAECLRAAAELIEAGARPEFISSSLYEQWSEGRFKLLCMALHSLEISDGRAVMTISKEMFITAGASSEDTENFANMPQMMKGIRLSVLFRETDEGWKASLRSKGELNVARISEGFGGGGHKNAAGFTIKADIETAKKMLIKRLGEKAS